MVRSIVRLYNNNDDDDGFYNFSRFPISMFQAKKKKLLSSTKQLYLFIFRQRCLKRRHTKSGHLFSMTFNFCKI
ncbi:hypothetical protein T02_12120 [Trichinella nativa]|uniref:Uncharacterized protein n=1 Tax=Trichinella nativa TaxID=6335 RepID=A0A0V1L3P6_9BILA|nr:hypothetical protein T02_12120 [Trichinella nativa]